MKTMLDLGLSVFAHLSDFMYNDFPIPGELQIEYKYHYVTIKESFYSTQYSFRPRNS